MVRKTSKKLEEPYQYFGLIYPTNKSGQNEIRNLLIGNGALNSTVYSILDYIFSPAPGSSIPICKTIVVEQRYRDKDHTHSLSSYYYKSFHQVKSECTRLHFFSNRLSPTSLDSIGNEELSQHYMGYCVLRPFPQRKIGRTVLKRINYVPTLEFPTCHGDFPVNLVGHRLSVKGPGFMEQDTMVSACATTALWMSTTTIGQRFNLRQSSTAEITQMATEYLISSRPMPSEGLLLEQMVHCLRKLSYDPLVIGRTDSVRVKHEIYTYIESELPPIILCELLSGGDHAIVGIGHGYHLPITNPFKISVDWPGEMPIQISRSSEWIPHFLINDDQRGLFRKLSFLDPTTWRQQLQNASITINTSDARFDEWNCPVTIDENYPNAGENRGQQIANIWAVIVPLPKGVLLTVEQAEKKSARLIKLWHYWNSLSVPTDLVLRTYLVQSNEYKERIKKTAVNDFVKSLIISKPMPRWIWVSEISSTNSYNSSNPTNWLINGQIIIDATGNAFTSDFLLFHYVSGNDGIVATMTPEHEDAEQAFDRYWVSNTDHSYQGWVR